MKLNTSCYQWLTGWMLSLMALTVLAQNSAPQYRVEADWPMDLPNDWILGQVSGIAVAPDDTIWVVHRPRSISDTEMGAALEPPLSQCCYPAPSVLQFDQEGNLLTAWGGPRWDIQEQEWKEPAYDWPENEHGIFVDDDGYIWLGGNGANDHIVTKFNADGEHLMTIGIVGETGGSNDTRRLGRPADVFVNTDTREVFVADGYGNRRVIVFDSDSGEYKRHWGAYGARPDDAPLPAYTQGQEPARQFTGPVHAVVQGPDGELYVADRTSNRVQVFDGSGNFHREAFLGLWTLDGGSVWDLAMSKTPDAGWLFVADGQNMKVWILDRDTLSPVGEFGRGGRQAGQFDWVHNLAVDASGNVYTAEVNNGRRIQKFIRTIQIRSRSARE